MDKIYEVLKEIKELMEENNRMLNKMVNIMSLENSNEEKTNETEIKDTRINKLPVGFEPAGTSFVADPLLFDVIDLVVKERNLSTFFVQSRFQLGYARAGRIVDQIEELGIASGFNGSKPRDIFYTQEQWEEKKKELLNGKDESKDN